MTMPGQLSQPRSLARRFLSQYAFLLPLAVGLIAADCIHGQNLIVNPDFNDSEAGWTAVNGTSIGTSTSDADFCPESLSLELGSAFFNGIHITEARQSGCVDVAVDETLFLQLTYASPAQLNGIFRICYLAAGCGGGVTSQGTILVGGPVGGFTTIQGTTVIPASCLSVQLSVISGHNAPHTLRTDRVYVGRASRISADDFEGGTFCRWTFAEESS